MFYWFFFLTGFFGFGAAAFLSFVHLGGRGALHSGNSPGHSGLGGNAHGGHGSFGSHGPVGPHGLAGHGHGGAPGNAGNQGQSPSGQPANQPQLHHVAAPSQADAVVQTPLIARVLLGVSPFDVFALSLGAGATGLLAQSYLSGAPQAAVALLGGLVFDFALMRQIMRVLLNAASKPSDTLEAAVGMQAQAITAFDTKGQGLVTLSLNQESIQLLAHLDAPEIHESIHVAKGDAVTIVAIDSHKGQCTVSRTMNQ